MINCVSHFQYTQRQRFHYQKGNFIDANDSLSRWNVVEDDYWVVPFHLLKIGKSHR